MSNDIKMRLVQVITSTGKLNPGVFDISDENKVRFAIEQCNAGNIIVIRGRIKGQTNFVNLKTITGLASEVVNVSTYDEIEIECTTFDPQVNVVKVIASSFNEAEGSTDIDVPFGDNLTEVELLTFTSSDSSVTITGDNVTKEINLTVTGGGGAVTSVNTQTGAVVLDTDNISEGSSLYFTNLRAQTATISQVITNGVTTKSPSEDIVFDSLALKINYSDLSTRIIYVDSVNGSDTATPGRGSEELPYATIQTAFNSVSAATSLNQWANERLSFYLFGGEYNEAPIVFYKRRSINFVGDGAKILLNFTLNYDPTAQYTGFTYTQAGLPTPWTGGFASPTLALGCAHNENGMESGFTTGGLMLLGRVIFTNPNYTTQTSPNYGTSYVTMNGVEARAGFQVNDSGPSSNSSVVLEAMTSVINGNNIGLTRAGGVASSFTLKASNSRITSDIGPRVIISKLDSCRLGKLDRNYLSYAEGAIQFNNATSTSGITSCTFVGTGTQNIGNYTGTSSSVLKTDIASWFQLRALTLNYGGGVTFNIIDAPKVLRTVAANAGSLTVANGTDHTLLDPASLIATYTLTMKPTPVDGDLYILSGGDFGITSLNLTPNAGQTFATGSSISTLPASSGIAWRWNSATSKWFRIWSTGIDALEFLSNKSTNLTSPDNIKYPTTLAVSTAITPYTNSFILASWTGPVLGVYSLSYPQATHLKGVNPTIDIYEFIASVYSPLDVPIEIDASGNIVLQVSQSPDLRFNGIVIIK